MPPFVEPLDVVVASQEAVPGLQLPPQEAQQVAGKVAPPVVDLTHDDVSGALGTQRRKMLKRVGKRERKKKALLSNFHVCTKQGSCWCFLLNLGKQDPTTHTTTLWRGCMSHDIQPLIIIMVSILPLSSISEIDRALQYVCRYR